MVRSVAVFCGSKSGNNPLFAEHAAELGKLLAALKVKLVFGGGKKGLMGIIADAALKHEGAVMGVIPKFLVEWEQQHEGLTELSIVPDMHTRKKMMYDLCAVCCENLPVQKPRYLMGVGTPWNILECISLGIDMFDCVMPTRNGRNAMLFTSRCVINIDNKK